MNEIILYRTPSGKEKSDFLINFLVKNLPENSFSSDTISLSVDKEVFLNFIYNTLLNFQERANNAESENELLTELNNNLVRIAKERANVERNLRPKKKHTGFVVLSFNSRFERVKNESFLTFKTVIQTPYNENWTFDSVLNRMWADFPFLYDFYDKDCKNLCNLLKDKKYYNKQFIFRWNLKLNNISSDKMSYWEVEIFSTQPLKFREE